MRVAIAQTAPILLDRAATLDRLCEWIAKAGGEGAQLVAFGEAFCPGYPVWLNRTGGARFDDPEQKHIHAIYVDQSVTIEAGHLADVQAAARSLGITVVLGIVERPSDRGQTLYCSRVIIGATGEILSVHRKLMPTHEERLCWGVGDGAGLVTHPLGEFTLGSLNCWENWMPLARTALYAQGEDLRVMIWPGGVVNTRDITRFVAREARSYVVSAGALVREQDIPQSVPMRDRIVSSGEVLHNGGGAIAGPDGEWIVEPVANEERLIVDPTGHYSRPEILGLTVDRTRHGVRFVGDGPSDGSAGGPTDRPTDSQRAP